MEIFYDAYIHAPDISCAITILRDMAGEVVDLVNPIYVNGLCAVFGEWSAPPIERGQRSVLELGLSFDPPIGGQDGITFDFPMLELDVLLNSACFDEIELIALDSIYKHKFFFSDLLVRTSYAILMKDATAF